MFTSTELLKLYLKEVISKEGLPASERTVRVWNDEKRNLGESVLKFLRVGDRGIYKRSRQEFLLAKDNNELIVYMQRFVEFCNRHILERFNLALRTLQDNNTSPRLLDYLNDLHIQLTNQNSNSFEDKVFLLIEKLQNIREEVNAIKEALDQMIEQFLNNMDNAILDRVYSNLQLRKAEAVVEEIDEELEEEDVVPIEEEIIPTTESERNFAKREIKKTLLWYSERIARDQKNPRSKVYEPIWGMISSLLPEPSVLIELGKKSIDRKVTNTLTQGATNLVNLIPRYYDKFRLELLKQNDNGFLSKNFEKDIKDKKISENEIDVLIFVMLRNTRKIFEKGESFKTNDLLRNVQSQYKTQIAVDEATDFSTIQLGCMFYLSHPRFTSVSLAGDLMQRLTRFGLTAWKDIELFAKFDFHSLNKVYRQSPKLLQIAKQLYKETIGDEAPFGSAFGDGDLYPEPLKFNSANNDELLGRWLIDRILEIHKICGRLPSIAIFVTEDKDGERVKELIKEELYENSIDVKWCRQGEIFGNEAKVRIFSVEYIKGLEFESVFFIDIDRIHIKEPELVDKYLYVGLTRAASYLGVTFSTEFPEKLRFIQNSFKEGDWKSFAA